MAFSSQPAQPSLSSSPAPVVFHMAQVSKVYVMGEVQVHALRSHLFPYQPTPAFHALRTWGD